MVKRLSDTRMREGERESRSWLKREDTCSLVVERQQRQLQDETE